MKLFFVCIACMAFAISAQATSFPAKMFVEVFEQGPSKNFIISPASIYSCLGLAYLGAEGTTAAEIKNVLELEGNTKQEIAQSYGEFFKRFEVPAFSDETKFEIVNRVYVDKKYEINPKYNELATKYFHSTAEPVDFADSTTTANKINSWVSEHTNDKIKDIVSPNSLDSSTSAVLVNAIYFKGHWDNRFEKDKTTKKDFFLSENDKKSVDMMYQQDYFKYADWHEIDATAIQIPYVNSDLYMLILLPKKVDGLHTVQEKFKTANLRAMHDRFSRKKVNLHLPKFKYDFDINLNKVLEKMGIKSMFSGNADFGSLLKAQQPLPVSDVIHKAFVEVDEYGTEASAATMIAVPMMAVMPPRDQTVYEYNVDHPFIFAIKDEKTIYFAGQVTNIEST